MKSIPLYKTFFLLGMALVLTAFFTETFLGEGQRTTLGEMVWWLENTYLLGLALVFLSGFLYFRRPP